MDNTQPLLPSLIFFLCSPWLTLYFHPRNSSLSPFKSLVSVLKEVVIIICILLSNLCTILDPSPPRVRWWSSMSSFSHDYQICKGYHSGAVRSLLLELTYTHWNNQFKQCYLHLRRPVWVPPDSVPSIEVLTSYLSATKCAELPTTI